MHKDEHKRQHHVPKAYQKNFCHDGTKLEVLDMHSGKMYSSNIDDIAVEKDFYTLEKLDDPYVWERGYGEGIEPEMAETLRSIIAKVSLPVRDNTYILTKDDKVRLAFIMVIQMLRGKQCREHMRKIFRKELPLVIEQVRSSLGGFNEKQLTLIKAFGNDEFYFKDSISSVTVDPDRIINYASLLGQYSFIIYRLQGNAEFVTSDNPVMFVNYATNDPTPFRNGLLQPTTIVYFPIAPKLMLSAIHPSVSSSITAQIDGLLIDLFVPNENSFIVDINRNQMQQCFRQVYAKSKKTIVNIY